MTSETNEKPFELLARQLRRVERQVPQEPMVLGTKRKSAGFEIKAGAVPVYAIRKR